MSADVGGDPTPDPCLGGFSERNLRWANVEVLERVGDCDLTDVLSIIAAADAVPRRERDGALGQRDDARDEVERLREALVQVVNAASLRAAQLVADEALRVPASGHKEGASDADA
jgi:hypothetical protein